MGWVDLLRAALSTRDERGGPTSARFRIMARRVVRRMLREEDCPVLDVAGREGFLLDPRVSPLADRTTVLDIEEAPLREGKRAWGGLGQFVCGDLARLPFRDGSFGAAVCVGTIYNLPARELVSAGLREMARVVRPGGRVICEFRNADNPVMRFARANRKRYDPSIGNLPFNPYSLEDIGRLLAEAGLEPVRIRPVMPPFMPLALMFIVEATPKVRGKENDHA